MSRTRLPSDTRLATRPTKKSRIWGAFREKCRRSPDRAGQVDESGLRVDEPVILEGRSQLTAEAESREVGVGRAAEDDAFADDQAVRELDLAELAAAPGLDRRTRQVIQGVAREPKGSAEPLDAGPLDRNRPVGTHARKSPVAFLEVGRQRLAEHLDQRDPPLVQVLELLIVEGRHSQGVMELPEVVVRDDGPCRGGDHIRFVEQRQDAVGAGPIAEGLDETRGPGSSGPASHRSGRPLEGLAVLPGPVASRSQWTSIADLGPAECPQVVALASLPLRIPIRPAPSPGPGPQVHDLEIGRRFDDGASFLDQPARRTKNRDQIEFLRGCERDLIQPGRFPDPDRKRDQ